MKMKRIAAGMLCICLLFCTFCTIPERRTQAKNLCIKLNKSALDMNGDGNPKSCIQVTDMGTLKCAVNGKKLSCESKEASKAAYIGCFCDSAKEIQLTISKNGKKYEAVYEQLRLCRIENLKGKVKNGVLTLKGLDPAGKPFTIIVSKKGKKRVVTFQKTTWKYFVEGSAIILKKMK